MKQGTQIIQRIRKWEMSKKDGVVSKEVIELEGSASSKGVVEGEVKVVKILEETTQIETGDILVCPSTNPNWVPVFRKIKAVITDIGGINSHAAIVSREYGIPAVTGRVVATSVLKTGDTVRVDGKTGVIKILKRG